MNSAAPAPKSKISDLLLEMVNKDASDLYLTFGFPPSIRIDNKIINIADKPLTDEDIKAIIDELLNEPQKEEFESTLELNIAIYGYHNKRFRANFFHQQHHYGVVIRRIRMRIPTLEALSLPPIYGKLIMEKRGLILMVGASGSGKSTSQAAMLGYRNEHGSGHIITVEDPIEFVHQHNKCIFTQREIGIDTYSYGVALKNALRQTPDVIVIGEVRDRDTMESALQFCETGHLCVATLHANNANQAIERMINLFPEEAHKQILLTISQNLKAIISQRLVNNLSGTRTLAVEIMLNQGLIKKLIEEGKIKEIKEIMEKNRDQGMLSFDQCLFDLYAQGKITSEVALAEADNASNLKLRISQEKNLNPLLKKTSYTPPSGSKPGSTN